MKVLLDTCTLVWLTQEPRRLSSACRRAIDEPATELVVSHASVWELALKSGAGKFAFPMPLRRWLHEQQKQWRFEYLSVSLEHVLKTTELARHHVDPFDRLLVAQAMAENVSVLTPDEHIARYPVHAIW